MYTGAIFPQEQLVRTEDHSWWWPLKRAQLKEEDCLDVMFMCLRYKQKLFFQSEQHFYWVASVWRSVNLFYCSTVWCVLMMQNTGLSKETCPAGGSLPTSKFIEGRHAFTFRLLNSYLDCWPQKEVLIVLQLVFKFTQHFLRFFNWYSMAAFRLKASIRAVSWRTSVLPTLCTSMPSVFKPMLSSDTNRT